MSVLHYDAVNQELTPTFQAMLQQCRTLPTTAFAPELIIRDFGGFMAGKSRATKKLHWQRYRGSYLRR